MVGYKVKFCNYCQSLNRRWPAMGARKNLRSPGHGPGCGLPPLPRRAVRRAESELLGKTLDGTRNRSKSSRWWECRPGTSSEACCLVISTDFAQPRNLQARALTSSLRK